MARTSLGLPDRRFTTIPTVPIPSYTIYADGRGVFNALPDPPATAAHTNPGLYHPEVNGPVPSSRRPTLRYVTYPNVRPLRNVCNQLFSPPPLHHAKKTTHSPCRKYANYAVAYGPVKARNLYVVIFTKNRLIFTITPAKHSPSF